jgi:hypothetical protein
VAVASWAVYLERRALERTPDERELFDAFSDLSGEVADGGGARRVGWRPAGWGRG